jgi:hypothetical protein
MWLLIAIVSIGVFVYLLFTEGFVLGKAWVYLASTAVGIVMFYIRRRQRLAAKK